MFNIFVGSNFFNFQNLGFGNLDLGFGIGPRLPFTNWPFWPIGCGPALLKIFILNIFLGQIKFHFSTQLIPAVQANCLSLLNMHLSIWHISYTNIPKLHIMAFYAKILPLSFGGTSLSTESRLGNPRALFLICLVA